MHLNIDLNASPKTGITAGITPIHSGGPNQFREARKRNLEPTE